MKNEEFELDFYNVKGDGNKTKNKKFLSKKHYISKDFKLEDFENSQKIKSILIIVLMISAMI